MNKVSKKYKLQKFKKTNLYKNKIKTNKLKLYNFIGGSINQALNLFKNENNFNKIKPYLKQEEVFNDIRLKEELQFDEDFNVTKIKISKGNEFKDYSVIKPLFEAILKILTEKADTYFTNYIEDYMRDYDITISFPNFINNNIEWIIKSYIDSKFYLTHNTTLTSNSTSSNNTTSMEPIIKDNLLFKNYNKFLELYTNLYLLLTNKKHFNSIIDLKIKTLTKNQDTNYSNNLNKLETFKNKLILTMNDFRNDIDEYNYYKNKVDKINTDIEIITNFKNDSIKYTEYLIDNLTKQKQKITNFIDKKIDRFQNLLELSTFIDEYKSYIDSIKVILHNLKLKKTAEGPDNIEIVVNTPILYVYKIKTFEGSMYYGSGTRWCISHPQEGKSHYNRNKNKNNLYIIQRKDDNDTNQEITNQYLLQKSTDKYLISVLDSKSRTEIMELSDHNNHNFHDINIIIEKFANDKQLIYFFNELAYTFNYKDDTLTVDVNDSKLFYKEFQFFNTTDFIKVLNNYITQNIQNTIKSFIFNPNIELDLVNALTEIKEFETLESITFGTNFDKQFNYSLNILHSHGLHELKQIIFKNTNYSHKKIYNI